MIDTEIVIEADGRRYTVDSPDIRIIDLPSQQPQLLVFSDRDGGRYIEMRRSPARKEDK